MKAITSQKQKPPYNAQEVALFLLSLDPEKKYFTNRKLNGFFKAEFSMGNFRLNAHLQIAQMLHYAHHQQPLFKDKIKAYEHGGYVEKIAQGFLSLRAAKEKINLDQATRQFLTSLFHYLKANYANRDLEYFVCEDIAWGNAQEKKAKNVFVYDEEVMDDYQVLISPLWEDMVGNYSSNA